MMQHPGKRPIGIAGVCTHLAGQPVALDWLVQNQFVSEETARDIANNGSGRYFRSQDQSPEDLAVAAVQALIRQTGADAATINLLIFTSTVFESTALYPDLVAQRIARKTGCVNAKACALQHAYCVSPLIGLQLATAYSQHHAESFQAIVVCADAMFGVTEGLRAIAGAGVHSDGAVAVLVTTENASHEIIDVEVHVDEAQFCGQHADGTLAAAQLHFAILANLVRGVMQRNGVGERAHLALCVNNLDITAWHAIGRALKIPAHNIHFDKTCGHVFGADPFINFSKARQSGAEYCLLAASGVAGTFGAALLKARNHG